MTIYPERNALAARLHALVDETSSFAELVGRCNVQATAGLFEQAGLAETHATLQHHAAHLALGIVMAQQFAPDEAQEVARQARDDFAAALLRVAAPLSFTHPDAE